MYGILTFDPDLRRRRIEVEHLVLLGRPFLHVTVRDEKQSRRAGRRLRKEGVRTLVPPERGTVPWEELGAHPVEVAPFLQSMAAPLVLDALGHLGKRPEESVVALRGDYATARLRQAAAALCPRVKGLALNVREGGDALAEELYAAFGLGVLQEKDRLVSDAAVCFSTWGAERPAGAALRLYGEEPELGGAALRCLEAPEIAGCDWLRLLAALWEAGALGTERVTAEWT